MSAAAIDSAAATKVPGLPRRAQCNGSTNQKQFGRKLFYPRFASQNHGAPRPGVTLELKSLSSHLWLAWIAAFSLTVRQPLFPPRAVGSDTGRPKTSEYSGNCFANMLMKAVFFCSISRESF